MININELLQKIKPYVLDWIARSVRTGAWTPTFTGLTVVGGPPIFAGSYTAIGHMVFYEITMNANGGTFASTGYGTYVNNLPFTSAHYNCGEALDASAALSKGIMMTEPGTANLHQPTWPATSDYLVLQGWYEK